MRRKKLFIAALAAMLLAIPAMVQSKKGEAAKQKTLEVSFDYQRQAGVHDEEGMQTMRQLGLNMAFMMKSIRLGLQQFGSPKIQEELTETHYIR
jgi:hypothetical protein